VRDFSFTVEGEPVTKGRPRCTCTSEGKVHVYTDDKTAQAEDVVGWAFKAAYPGHEPVSGEVSLLVMVGTNKSRANRASADADNYAKLVMDALNGIAWVDDRQVTHLSVHISPTRGPGPYTNVQIRTLEPGDDQ
jgi:crossover junction endodeoxyribonuclease RusA